MILIVPDPAKAQAAARRLLTDIEAEGKGKLIVDVGAMLMAFDAAQKRLLSHLLDLNPDLRLTTPDGVDVTHLYAKTTETGA